MANQTTPVIQVKDSNVGIGTTSPYTKLSVVQDITTTAEFGSFGQFTLQGATNLNKILSFGFNTTSDVGFIQPMVNGTSYNNLLLNALGGNVLIGTTTDSGYKLAVAGNVVLGYAQNRPVFYDSNGGNFQIKANAGGWATGYFFQGSSGTFRGGWGGFGSADTLGYLWAGDAYDTPTIVVQGAQGNVGIGTTTPGFKLDVAGSGRFSNGYSGTLTVKHNYSFQQPNWGIKLDGDTATSGGYLSQYVNIGGFELAQGGTYYGAGYYRTDANSTSFSSVSGYSGIITFSTDSGLTANTSFTASERMRITSGGNVGIGTNSPLSKLDVSITSSQALFIANESGTITDGDLLGAVSFGSRDGSTYSSGGVTNIRSYATSTYNTGNVSGDIRFYVSSSLQNTTQAALFGTEAMRITAGGNLLIGTTTDSGYKLRVNGTAGIDSTLRLVGNIQVGSDTTQWSLTGVANGGAIWQKTHSGAGGFDDRYLRLGNVDNNGTPNYVLTVINSNVGIGTTNPSTQLHISGTTTNITITDTSYGRTSNVGYIDSANLYLANDANSNTYIGRYNGVFLAYGGGNVLIGSTTDAGFKLDVHGEILGRDDMRILNTYALVLNGSDDNWRIGRNTITDSGWLTGNTTQIVVSNASSGQGFQVVNSGGTALFEVEGISGYTRISISLGVGVNPSGTTGRIDASNDIVAYSSSDLRLKENIKPIENALDKVKALTGVEFDWKAEHKEAHGYEGHDTGVIAQEVQAVMPTAVRTNDTGYLAVRYEKLIGLLIEAVKEQQAEIDELKKLIK